MNNVIKLVALLVMGAGVTVVVPSATAVAGSPTVQAGSDSSAVAAASFRRPRECVAWRCRV